MDDMFDSGNNGGNYNNNGSYNDNGNYNNGYNYNSGYGGSNNTPYYPDGQFRGDYRDQGDMMPERKGGGFAIASFVIALVNLILCCTTLTVIAAPLCIIFSIISLVQKRKGTAFAIIGLIVSVFSLLIFAYYGVIAYKVAPDIMYFVNNSSQIVEDYDRDGTIPERYEKYRDPKYDKYWKSSGYDNFDEFFAEFIKPYRSGTANSGGVYSYNDDDNGDSSGGYDHSGEDLVVIG